MRYNIGDIVKRDNDEEGTYAQIIEKNLESKTYFVKLFDKKGFWGIGSYAYDGCISFKLCSQENKNCKQCKSRLKCLIDGVKPFITALSTKIKL